MLTASSLMLGHTLGACTSCGMDGELEAACGSSPGRQGQVGGRCVGLGPGVVAETPLAVTPFLPAAPAPTCPPATPWQQLSQETAPQRPTSAHCMARWGGWGDKNLCPPAKCHRAAPPRTFLAVNLTSTPLQPGHPVASSCLLQAPAIYRVGVRFGAPRRPLFPGRCQCLPSHRGGRTRAQNTLPSCLAQPPQHGQVMYGPLALPGSNSRWTGSAGAGSEPGAWSRGWGEAWLWRQPFPERHRPG